MAVLRRPGREPSDEELVHCARRDPAAFEVLFERHAALMQRWLIAQCSDAATAHELLAETFALAWREAKRFRGGGEGTAVAWLYGIARNLLRHHYRQGRVQTRARERLALSTQTTHYDDANHIDFVLDARDMAPAVRAAFGELTPDQQAAIRFRVIRELSYEEVARELSCSAVTARTRVFRGLQALRAAVDRGALT